MNTLRLTEAKLAEIVQKNRPRVVKRNLDAPIVKAKPKKSKYRNVRSWCEGKTFASTKEKNRYVDLRWQEHCELIKELRCQVPYRLSVNGVDICGYIADFVYRDLKGKERVEDVKGYRKGEAYRLFRIKQALMKACHSIVVKEV